MFILWLKHIERKFYSMLINCSKSLSIGYIKAIKFVFNEKKNISSAYCYELLYQPHNTKSSRFVPTTDTSELLSCVCVLEQINVTYFNQKTVTLNGFLLPLCAVTCVICVPCINSKHGNTITQIDWHVKDSWMSILSSFRRSARQFDFARHLHEKCIIISLIHTHLPFVYVRWFAYVHIRCSLCFVGGTMAVAGGEWCCDGDGVRCFFSSSLQFEIQKSHSRFYEPFFTCHPLEAFEVHAQK